MKALIVIFILVLLPLNCFSQSAYSEKLDQLFQFYSRENLFNGSVLISKKGEILLNKGYGFQNAELKKLNEPATIFQIYSITKTFTSTVILKLVEEKRLNLSDKLSRFYPGFPHADSITIEQLLTHTSGIYDYTRGNDMKDQTEKSFIDFHKTKQLDFPPGKGWSYSNSGYYFLGYIVERVTGLRFEDAVAKHVFKPLRMNQSGFAFKNLQDRRKAIGYEILRGKSIKKSIIYEPPGPFSAGGIYSTVEDLHAYYNGLKSYKIISKEMLDKAFTPFENSYGYGWMIIQMFDRKTAGHSGAGAGFKTNFLQITEEDICIILLANCEKDITNLTGTTLKILLDKPYKIPTSPIKLDEEHLGQYVGTYAVNKDFIIYVFIENGKLISQPTNQPPTILYPDKGNLFYVEELSDYIHFEKDANGQVMTLVFRKNGSDIKGERIFPSWGITGSSTEQGWNGQDEALAETSVKGVWSIEHLKLKSGEIKFRFNNDWTINLGLDSGGNLIREGGNIKINDGIYSVVLDVRQENPTYKISKQY